MPESDPGHPDMTAKPATEAGQSPQVAAVVGSLQEADVIRAALAGEGIESFIENENLAYWGYWGPGLFPAGIRVFVRGADAQAAEAFLKALRKVPGKTAPAEMQSQALGPHLGKWVCT